MSFAVALNDFSVLQGNMKSDRISRVAGTRRGIRVKKFMAFGINGIYLYHLRSNYIFRFGD